MAETGTTVKNVLYIALGAGALLGMYKLFQKFGIIKTAEEEQSQLVTKKAGGDSTTIDSKNSFLSFNPNYWITIIKSFNSKKMKITMAVQQIVSYSELVKMAEEVKNSYGYFHDDNEKLYNVFRTIQTQFQLSLLAYTFKEKYKKDMLAYMQSFMSESEMAGIYDIINNYPLLIKQ